jgi:DNA-binding NarL/FixJ family response regulator
MRVVIADDSRMVRERLAAALLEIDGVALLGQPSNASAAIDSVHRLKPDVVIMDIMLNGELGLEALIAIKRCRPAPVVVMFTNYCEAEYEENARAAGADFFFAKSTEFKAMFETLKVLTKGGLSARFDLGNSGTHSARYEKVERVRKSSF